jgi:hypothetical protein
MAEGTWVGLEDVHARKVVAGVLDAGSGTDTTSAWLAFPAPARATSSAKDQLPQQRRGRATVRPCRKTRVVRHPELVSIIDA